MKRILASALLAVSLFSFSCKKDDPAPAATFFPLTVGSSWTYRETVSNTTYTFTVQNKDSVFLGKTYKVLSNSLGGNVYAAVVGNDYYRYGVLPTQALTGSGLEEYYLKSDAGNGGTWNQTQNVTFQGTVYPLRFNYTLASTGGSRTVAGKSFTDVARVDLDLRLSFNGIQLSVGSGTFYYAANIGLIESTLNISLAVPGQTPYTVNQNTLIQSYTIK